MTTERAIQWIEVGAMLAVAVAAMWLASCSSPQQKRAVEGVVVKVAEDLCVEEIGASAASADPDLVALLCRAGADTVKVLLPRQEWHAIRARRSGVDAGPGK